MGDPLRFRSRRSFLGLALGFVAAGAALASTPPAPVDVEALALRAFTEDGEVRVRYAAARLLSPRGHLAARDFLLAALLEEPTGLGMLDDVLAGLAATDDEEVRAALVAQVSGAKTPLTRSKVAAAALRVSPQEALAAAQAVLEDAARPRESKLARVVAPYAAADEVLGGAVLRAAYRKYGADQAAGPALITALSQVDPTLAEALILEAVTSPRWTARAGAARHLRRLPKAVAAPRLRNLLETDPAYQVRQAAADTLLSKDIIGLGEAATELVGKASLPAMFRAHLIDTLGRIRWSPAAPRLLPLLLAGQPQVRAAAARALGSMGATQAEAPMLEILADRDQPDPLWMRTWCARGLAGMRTPAVRSGLTDALRLDTIGYVIESAARSLAAHGTDDAWSALRGALGPELSVMTRVAAATALGSHDPAVFELGQLTQQDQPLAVQVAAARALGASLSPGRVGPLLKAFEYGDPELQSAAGLSLARRDPWAQAAADLAKSWLGKAPGEDLRLVAARVLSRAGGDQAAKALAAGATTDQARDVRARCLRELAALDTVRALTARRQVLAQDPDKTMRLTAAAGLSATPGEAWSELRAAVLRDPEAIVRRRALLALAKLLGETVVVD